MTDKTIDLDQHRGTAARRAKDLRRLGERGGAIKTHYVFGRNNWKPVWSRRRQQIGAKPPRMLAILNLFAAALTSEDPR